MSMKKIWSAPLALIVVVTMALFFGGITVSADEENSCGAYATWSYADGTLTISGTGATDDYDWENLPPWQNESITKVVIGEGITRVGNYAFRDQRGLTSVELPSTLKSFGNLSFANTGLTEVSIPANLESLGEYTFNGCSALTTVNIPSNTKLTTISKGAFSYCGTLSSINLPDTITSIGDEAFQEDIALAFTALPANLKSIGACAFSDCTGLTTLNLGSKLETIGGNAFYECENLTSVEFPATLKTIDYWAFRETAITELSLPSGVTYIGSGAFNQCHGLTNVNLSFSGNIEIGESAFSNCQNLETFKITGNFTVLSSYMFSGDQKLNSVSIPDSVTTVGNGVFSSCEALKSFTWPSSLTSVGSNVFTYSGLESATVPANVTFDNGTFSNCFSLSQVTIENGVTVITKEMFNNCSALKAVTLPASLTEIREGAFKYSGLKSVDIPASVKVISYRAFADCRQIESITLHEGLERLEDYAFEWCEKLPAIEIPSTCTAIGNRVLACTDIKSVTLTINDDEHLKPTELFSGCNKLESITIKGNMTKIPYGMFYSCGNLKNLTLPDTITEIDRYAFYGCRSLANFTIPADVTTIGEYAFSGCRSITSLTIPSKVTSIGEGAFQQTGLKSIVIPNNVTMMGSYMFSDCGNLTSITLPTNIHAIPGYFFSGCIGLKTYTIPSHITVIDPHAFDNSSLTSITIPGTVQFIGEGAFSESGSLTSVEILDGVIEIDSLAFGSCRLLETVIISGTVTELAADSFRYSNYIKTIYCSQAQKDKIYDYCTAYNQDLEFIIINSISELNTPHIVGHSITLSADIGMNFFIRLPAEYTASNTTVEFTWGEGVDYNTQKSYVHNVQGTLVPIDQHGANYIVTCGVAARSMCDKITMVVKSGNTVLLTDEYAIITYMNKLWAATNDSRLQSLLLAMAYYGTSSQEYFRYRTYNNPYDLLDTGTLWFNPVENYREKSIEGITADAANMTIRNIASDSLGLKYYGASIQCTSQMKMRFYFEVTDADAFNAISGTASFKGVSLKFVNKKVSGQDLVYIETQGLAPGDLETVFEISIGGNVYKYDFKDYIERVGSVDSRFVDTAKYVYAYSHFARLYKTGEY